MSMFKWPKRINVVRFADGRYGVRIGRFFGFEYIDTGYLRGQDYTWSTPMHVHRYCKFNDIETARNTLYVYTIAHDKGIVL